MGGSGTVFGAARAIAELKPNVEVHFIVASCENMVSANAYRPGDIIKASNGKTIEVGNTDAGTFSLVGRVGFGGKEGGRRGVVGAAWKRWSIVSLQRVRRALGPLGDSD